MIIDKYMKEKQFFLYENKNILYVKQSQTIYHYT